MENDFSRRHFVKISGLARVASPFGRGRRAAAGEGSIMDTLSNYMSSAATRPLPDAALEKTKHVILDTFAAMISGADLPPGRFAIQFARNYKGEKICTVA